MSGMHKVRNELLLVTFTLVCSLRLDLCLILTICIIKGEVGHRDFKRISKVKITAL